MFPMCHIYFAKMILSDNLSEFSIIGSIYPDIIISGVLDREITHYNTRELYEYFGLRDKYMKEFAVGAITHGIDMKGLDYYSDEYYNGFDTGYCFIKGKEIEKEVISCCNIPQKWGLWKAHNFIEMAFELYLCKNNSWIEKLFYKILNDTCIVKYVNQNLGDYYGIEENVLNESFKRFTEFVQYDSTDEYSIINRYALQIYKKHGINNVNVKQGADIITKSVDIIKNEIDDFNFIITKNIKQVLEKI